MIRRRASLAMLMGLVAIIAVGLAAMKVATDGVALGVIITSLTTLLIAMVGAQVRRERAAWVGFSMFGWAYLLALAIPMLLPHLIQSLEMNDMARLQIDGPVIQCVGWLHPELPEPGPPPYEFRSISNRVKTNGSILTPEEDELYDNFLGRVASYKGRLHTQSCARWIGLAIQGLAFAGIGALIGHLVDDRYSPAGSSPATETFILTG
jgi:hypothetical protein